MLYIYIYIYICVFSVENKKYFIIDCYLFLFYSQRPTRWANVRHIQTKVNFHYIYIFVYRKIFEIQTNHKCNLNMEMASLHDQKGVHMIWPDRHIDRQKDRKNEGPKILSNNIFFLKTFVIGGPNTKINFHV